MPQLNDHHCHHLLALFLAIEERLVSLDSLIARSESPSPLSPIVMDVSPTECRVVRDHFARIRSAMITHLHDLGIPLELRKRSVRWALETSLVHVSVIVDDMGPRQLAGYGPLEPSGQAAVARIQDDLTRLVNRALAYTHQGLGRDLSTRLARLDASRAGVEVLSTLERIVTRWQLVEYRPTLEMIVRRIEKPCFEVAIFGRVSSGKSSLLNHIAGSDVLPVGVTPVTAVPTRLEHGNRPAAVVSFSETAFRIVPIDQLWEYASEEGNPGNRRHVTNIVVQLPSSRLRSGVVLVDTPGLGSLATSGAAEAMAYLPRCDLGIIMIDAASTLNQDDVALLRTLYEFGAPAMVLLSKVDLLSKNGRERMAAYIREQLQRELGLELAVHPVSVLGADESLLLQWFDSEISPLFERHQELAEASFRRKIASLSESVAISLEMLLNRSGTKGDRQNKARLAEARRFLDEADDAIRRARQQVFDWSMSRERVPELIFQFAAQAAAGKRPSHASDDPLFDVARDVLAQRAGMAHDLVAGLEHALRGSQEGLRRAWPIADNAIAPGVGVRRDGMPIPDLDPFQTQTSRLRPWWVSALPRIAVRVARRRLEEQFGEAIFACVDTYDRQLEAWSKLELERVVEHYELEAAPIREQIRRFALDGTSTVAGEDGLDRAALETDLRALGRPGQGGDDSTSSSLADAVKMRGTTSVSDDHTL